jgi:hypothetical protein
LVASVAPPSSIPHRCGWRHHSGSRIIFRHLCVEEPYIIVRRHDGGASSDADRTRANPADGQTHHQLGWGARDVEHPIDNKADGAGVVADAIIAYGETNDKEMPRWLLKKIIKEALRTGFGNCCERSVLSPIGLLRS